MKTIAWGEKPERVGMGLYMVVNDSQIGVATADLSTFIRLQDAVNGAVETEIKGETITFRVAEDAEPLVLEEAEFELLEKRLNAKQQWDPQMVRPVLALKEAMAAAKAAEPAKKGGKAAA